MSIRYYISILSILLFQSCITLDFIPDPDYSVQNRHYRKESWDSVEIHLKPPEREYTTYGEMIIRHFSGSRDDLLKNKWLKKELFVRKFDGIIIVKSGITGIVPVIINTKNSEGVTVSVYRAQREMSYITGNPFRYDP